jgi:hypothetical protein
MQFLSKQFKEQRTNRSRKQCFLFLMKYLKGMRKKITLNFRSNDKTRDNLIKFDLLLYVGINKKQ